VNYAARNLVLIHADWLQRTCDCILQLSTWNSELSTAPLRGAKQDLHIQFASNSHPFVILKELIAARMRGKGSSVGGRMR